MPRRRTLLVKIIIYFVVVFCLFVSRYGEVTNTSIEKYKHLMDASYNFYFRKINTINVKKEKEWTIMLSVNNGYKDFFLNWLAAYRKADLDYPIIVIAEDHDLVKYMDKYKTNKMRIIESELPHINNTVIFGSKQFNELSVRRHTYILKELEDGSDIVFSDTDTVWLKNPVPYFTGNYDIWMQLDKEGYFCPGLMAIKSSETTISFFKNLTHGLSLTSQADQPYINNIIGNSDVRVAALPVYEFPSGRQYFGQFSSVNRSKAVVVHNNWIKGHEAKFSRFLKFNLWFLKR